MEYLPESAPLFSRLGVMPQAHIPRWSGLIIESRIEKVLAKYDLRPEDFTGRPALWRHDWRARICRPISRRGLAALRADLEARYAAIGNAVEDVDPTLSALSSRRATRRSRGRTRSRRNWSRASSAPSRPRPARLARPARRSCQRGSRRSGC